MCLRYALEEDTPNAICMVLIRNRCIRGKRECIFDIENPHTFFLNHTQLFDNEVEKKYFDYALVEGTQVISPYKPFLMVIWNEIVAQIGLQHHHIIHSMTALGAIQKFSHDKYVRYVEDETTREAFSMALEEQNRAIRLVRQKALPEDVMILFTLLAHCLSSWTNKMAAPLAHLRAAQSMLRAYEKNVEHSNHLRSSLVDNALRPIIMQFELEALTFTDGVHTSRPLRAYVSRHDLEIPSKLSPNDVLHRLEQLLNVTLCLDDDEGQAYDQQLRDDIEVAVSKLYALLRRTIVGCEDQQLRSEYENLLPHCMVLKIMLACKKDGDENAYELHISDMESIVNLVQANLKAYELDNERHGSRMQVQFSSMAPLFFVATHCRDSDTRRRALAVLHGSHRRERKLTSCMAARVARFVVEEECKREEVGLVGSHNRIVLAGVQFSRISRTLIIAWYPASEGRNNVKSLTHKYLPYEPHLHADDGEANMYMSRKILRASCYCGTLLLTPAVDCHCAD